MDLIMVQTRKNLQPSVKLKTADLRDIFKKKVQKRIIKSCPCESLFLKDMISLHNKPFFTWI